MVMPRTLSAEPFAAAGAETEEGSRPTLVSAPAAASPELVDRPRRRRTFTAADKVRILAEIDCAGPGGRGAILRRAAGATFSTRGNVLISAGQSVIDSGLLVLGDTKHAVANRETIGVDVGTLTVGGDVNGRGVAEIGAGLLYVTSKFAEHVYFIGVGGTLKFGNSQTFTGAINGFSQAGDTIIDFSDIGFISSAEASFSENKNGGVLTVSNGTTSARVNLNGNYLGATFAASADGSGGTEIVAEASNFMTPPHALIAAMAALGTGGGQP